VERLESLTRKQRRFARAWSLLSVGYLSLGGKDETSLTQIAEAAAERAIALDPALADAQSALGLVRLRRGEWVAAMEHFEAALALDANEIPALEGSACLLMEVGHTAAALPVAQRAVALQPGNIGANECLAFARLATGTPTPRTQDAPGKPEPLQVARVTVLGALLSSDAATAQQTLRDVMNTATTAVWIEPLLQAAANPRKTSEALRAITRAASDDAIDPATEVVCGAALRQSDFVFNRMLRLHKQNEPVPLRVLWLPQTAFLRQHPRFEEIVSAEGLLPFWQDHGLPDVCATEPGIYGCKLGKRK
jgi:Flp pilus assembly protein TadD